MAESDGVRYMKRSIHQRKSESILKFDAGNAGQYYFTTEALNALNMIEAEHTRMRVLNQPSPEMTPT